MPGRLQDAPRRSQTPQDGSKLVPRGARKRPRRRQIRGKKRHPLQISFLERFWADFGRFSDGFGKVLGMILDAWRSIFQGFWELHRNHRKQHDATGKTFKRPPRRFQETPRDFQNPLKPMLHQCEASAASERAQRAKRAERAIQEASKWMHEAISSLRNDFLRLP